MKAKLILRHQSEIADPLRPHTTGILPDADQRLHELLHEWRPECAPLPPHFAEQVWQRIRRSEEQAAQTHALPGGARHDQPYLKIPRELRERPPNYEDETK